MVRMTVIALLAACGIASASYASDPAAEMRRLYHELETFKDRPSFHKYGFAAGGPYERWWRDLKALMDDERSYGLELATPCNLVPGDLMVLALEYMNQASNDYTTTMSANFAKCFAAGAAAPAAPHSAATKPDMRVQGKGSRRPRSE